MYSLTSQTSVETPPPGRSHAATSGLGYAQVAGSHHSQTSTYVKFICSVSIAVAVVTVVFHCCSKIALAVVSKFIQDVLLQSSEFGLGLPLASGISWLDVVGGD